MLDLEAFILQKTLDENKKLKERIDELKKELKEVRDANNYILQSTGLR